MKQQPVAAAGMPPIGQGEPPLSFFEFWPAWLFYAPVWIWIVLLMLWHRSIRLPLLANPTLPAGGLVGVSTGMLLAALILGRRAERAAYSQIEGQPGAAAAVLNSLGKGWFVTPAVAVTKNQDIVHRVIGRPGVILVGEGVGSRVTNALRNEQKELGKRIGPLQGRLKKASDDERPAVQSELDALMAEASGLAERVKAAMPAMRATLPPAIRVDLLSDQSTFVTRVRYTLSTRLSTSGLSRSFSEKLEKPLMSEKKTVMSSTFASSERRSLPATSWSTSWRSM